MSSDDSARAAAPLARTHLSGRGSGGMLRHLDALARRWPVGFACGTAAMKTTSADLIVQTLIEKREKLDLQRTAAFGLFGFGWMGGGQYWVYVTLLPRLLPATTVPATLGKVALDQFIHVPFVFMPLFYCVDGMVLAAKPVDDGPVLQQRDVLAYARKKWNDEIVETMLANWKLWLPAQCVGFGIVPPHLRIPYVSCVSFVWTTILSLMQGKFRDAARTQRSEV